MGGKHLFAGDRLLRAAESSTASKSGTDLLDLGEDEIWAAGTPSSASGGVWSLQRCGGSRDYSRHVGGPSMVFETSEDEAAFRRRPGSPMATEELKSAPVSVPGWGRMGGSAEAEREEEEWLPPHEYVARVHGKMAVATSVFEGVGRTLKGRDMSTRFGVGPDSSVEPTLRDCSSNQMRNNS